MVTDLSSGAVTEVWGISNCTESVKLTLPDPAPEHAAKTLLPPLSISSLAPNDEWAVATGGGGKAPVATIIRKTPFYPPF